MATEASLESQNSGQRIVADADRVGPVPLADGVAGSLIEHDRPSTVLIVDDEKRNVLLLSELMEEQGYRAEGAFDGEEALRKVEEHPPDLIFLDVMMPKVDGYEVCSRLKGRSQTRLIPIVVVTGLGDLSSKIRAIEAGADDFISKPYAEVEVVARARSLLRLKNLTDQLDSAEQVLFSFARTVDAKDDYTGKHTERVSAYALSLAERLGCSDRQRTGLSQGTILHDVGKIGIPDHILNKPGKLTSEEFELMKRHTIIGYEILKPLRSIHDALPCVRWHHERLDGSGYPDGLKGDEIPLTVQIMALADVYDALATERSYRVALPQEHCFAILRQDAHNGWRDEKLVECLIEMIGDA